jgi:hypothetical protein
MAAEQMKADTPPQMNKGIERSLQTLVEIVPGLSNAIRTGVALDLGLSDRQPDGINEGSGLVVSIGPTEAGADPLAELPGNQAWLMLRDVIQNVRDYRGLIRAAFNRLAIGGILIITVPHQFLFERKYRRPSRYGSTAYRFYTPASLLMEIQEAIEPTEHRILVLKDDDAGYDYAAGLGAVPDGNKRIVLAIRRIERPWWADEMKRDDDPRKVSDIPGVPVIDPGAPAIQYVLTSSSAAIERILVFKLDHRGDYTLSLHALGELRRLYPHSHVTLLCGSWNKEAAQTSGLFNEVMTLDFVAEDSSSDEPPMTLEAAYALQESLLGGRTFDLALDLSFHEKTRPLVGRVKARHRAGFDRWNQFPYLDIRLSLPTPSVDGSAVEGLMAPAQFGTRKGVHKLYAIDFSQRRLTSELDEAIMWGPYSQFGPGDYQFEFFLEARDGVQELGFEICHTGGSKVIQAGVVTLGEKEFPKVSVSLLKTVQDLEIRFRVIDNAPLSFRFLGVGYRREAQIIGIHQLEAMSLLVHLVGVRLRQPYVKESFFA